MAINFKFCFHIFLLQSLLFPLCSPQPAGPAPSPQDHNGPKLPPKSPPPPSFSPLPSANSYPPPEWAAAPPPPGEARKESAMNGGQKAGIAVGVLAGAAVIGLGGMVYKKRRSNIRRAHFGQAARRSFL